MQNIKIFFYSLVLLLPFVLQAQDNLPPSFPGFTPQHTGLYTVPSAEKIELERFEISPDTKHYLFIDRSHKEKLIVDGKIFPPADEKNYSEIKFAHYNFNGDVYVLLYQSKTLPPEKNKKVAKKKNDFNVSITKLKSEFSNGNKSSQLEQVYSLYKGEEKLGDFEYLSDPIFSKDKKSMLATGFRNGKAVYVWNDQVVEMEKEITIPLSDEEKNSLSFFAKKGSHFLWIKNGEVQGKFDSLRQYDPNYAGGESKFFAQKGKYLHFIVDGTEQLVFPKIDFDEIGSLPYKKTVELLVLTQKINSSEKDKSLTPSSKYYVALNGKILGPYEGVRHPLTEKAYWIAKEGKKEKLYFKDQLLAEASQISDFHLFQEQALYILTEGEEKFIVQGDRKEGPYSEVLPFKVPRNFYSYREEEFSKSKDVVTVVKTGEQYSLWQNGKLKPLLLNAGEQIVNFALSENSARYFLLLKKGNAYQVLGPQGRSKPYEEITALTSNASGDHYVFVSKKWVGNEQKEFVVHDGIEDPPYLKIRDLYFSRTGKINYKAQNYEFKKLFDPHQDTYVVEGQKMNALQFEKSRKGPRLTQTFYLPGNDERKFWIGYGEGKCAKAALVDMYFQANIPICTKDTKQLLMIQNKKIKNLGEYDDLYEAFLSEDKKQVGVFGLKGNQLYWIVETVDAGGVE